MSEEYRAMWESLGLDLEAHDQLLSALGEGYRQVFLSQEGRPRGMEYFDFVMSEVHGLRIKELLAAKAEGRKVVGAFCVFVPEELVRATGSELVGLCAGADFAVEEVDRILPRNTCALIKSAFGFKLGRVCPYVESADLVVGENTCDGKKKGYELFAELVPQLYVMDLPQMKSEAGRELLRAEYRRFQDRLEELTGVEITAERLRQGIQVVNRKRRALARLWSLRRHDPAPISGLDALLVSQVSFYDDPERFSGAVEKLCDELEERVRQGQGVAPAGSKRLVVSGCPMAVPNWKLPAIVEGAGAVIVGEESCVGERGLRNLVDESPSDRDGLLEAIVDRYWQIDCAIFTPNPQRRQRLQQMVTDYQVQGVIHYCLQFCQPYQMEAMLVERELEAAGIPLLRVDTDYGQEDVEQLKTRVEAFLEMLG